MTVRILEGDALTVLRELPDASVRCCVTSPPYWGLRDYGVVGQLGLEATPAEYVEKLVAVFRDVRRVLADDGTLWLNLGDSYAGSRRGIGDTKTMNKGNGASRDMHDAKVEAGAIGRAWVKPPEGMNVKNLVGIPWRVAFALQADGWYLRSDIIWSKPNPMPESVTDRPTKAHEYLFLLAKSERYYYDGEAIAEPADPANATRYDSDFTGSNPELQKPNGTRTHPGGKREWKETRNSRTVWTITTRPYLGAHFATFPVELPRRCILAGSARDDMILDPFGGAGTTGLVADRLGRHAILIELNPKYAQMARHRITDDAPLFVDVPLAGSR